MAKYRVLYSAEAVKQLKKMDVHTRAVIYAWIEKNLVGCENPKAKGKALTANRSGQWRYRIGDYRLLCKIDEGKLTILALSIGHRCDVYS